MGGTSTPAEDTKRSDASTGGPSATLKAAIITALAAIIGSSIGAAGTLAVSSQQIKLSARNRPKKTDCEWPALTRAAGCSRGEAGCQAVVGTAGGHRGSDMRRDPQGHRR
jgi:hypothetical protein